MQNLALPFMVIQVVFYVLIQIFEWLPGVTNPRKNLIYVRFILVLFPGRLIIIGL